MIRLIDTHIFQGYFTDWHFSNDMIVPVPVKESWRLGVKSFYTFNHVKLCIFLGTFWTHLTNLTVSSPESSQYPASQQWPHDGHGLPHQTIPERHIFAPDLLVHKK